MCIRDSWERLDRALATDQWRIDYPSAHITHLPRISSDHAPLLLKLDREDVWGPKPFCFENLWYEYQRATEIVEEEWKRKTNEDPVDKVFAKLSNIKNSLNSCNKH